MQWIENLKKDNWYILINLGVTNHHLVRWAPLSTCFPFQNCMEQVCSSRIVWKHWCFHQNWHSRCQRPVCPLLLWFPRSLFYICYNLSCFPALYNNSASSFDRLVWRLCFAFSCFSNMSESKPEKWGCWQSIEVFQLKICRRNGRFQ